MISISEKASKKIKNMALDSNCGPDIRVMVVDGGCSGLSYDMDFENPNSSKSCGCGSSFAV